MFWFQCTSNCRGNGSKSLTYVSFVLQLLFYTQLSSTVLFIGVTSVVYLTIWPTLSWVHHHPPPPPLDTCFSLGIPGLHKHKHVCRSVWQWLVQSGYLFVAPAGICQRPLFNSDARDISECLRCFCFDTTDQCTSSSLYKSQVRARAPVVKVHMHSYVFAAMDI